jgi:hypothetical protein
MPAATGDGLALKGVTDAAGNAVFNLAPYGFTVVPAVGVSVETANTNVTEARITALTTTSLTVNVRSSAGINVALLGLTLLGLPTPLAGATVHAIVHPQT